MRRLLPLAVLALAACDPPASELTPPSYYSFEHEGISYDMRAQFDPLVWGWFVRVWSIEVQPDLRDEAAAIQLVEKDLGPQLCAGHEMEVKPGRVWNPMAGNGIEYMPNFAGFQFVARCT